MNKENYKYMQRAIELAKKGEGFVNPNPLVGAVIVKNGKIISEGWHEQYGKEHAERNAINKCKEDLKGAELYVTLEPCCHTGKQPPCTDAIIESGISTVYIGSRDPNPLVAGKGTEKLRTTGIEVIEDFMREECDTLNPIFFHYITTKKPYVILKYAMTADGKIACCTGDSKWITGESARKNVHMTRNRVSAILVGIGTVLADNPMLDCRLPDTKNPIRIICDSHLRIPLDCNIVNTAREIPTYIMTLDDTTPKIKELRNFGVRVCKMPVHNGSIDISAVIDFIGANGWDSVLVEGGSKILASFLSNNIAQEVQVYIAPKWIGGDGISPIGTMNIKTMSEAVFTKSAPEVKIFDKDILLTYKI